MKEEKKAINEFELTCAKVDIIRDIMEKIKREVDDLLNKYEFTGYSTEQRKHWKTGELIWEDEKKTIPSYEKTYETRRLEVSELDDNEYAKYVAYKEIMDYLTKSINLK